MTDLQTREQMLLQMEREAVRTKERLDEEFKARRDRIGRIEFKSAGQTRKR